MSVSCSHLDQVKLTELPASIEGCEDCLKIGARWFHLRMCTACGHIGCCDSSPSRHARQHAADTGHPIMCSFEPGETWFWDFATDQAVSSLPWMAPT